MVAQAKKAAIKLIVQGIRPKREQIARSVAKALTDLTSALKQEQQFNDELALLDPAIAQAMCPAIFPAHVLADSAVLGWQMQATELGLLGSDSAGPRPN